MAPVPPDLPEPLGAPRLEVQTVQNQPHSTPFGHYVMQELTKKVSTESKQP